MWQRIAAIAGVVGVCYFQCEMDGLLAAFAIAGVVLLGVADARR